MFLVVVIDRNGCCSTELCEGAYIMNGVHELGEVVESLGTCHYALLLHVNSLGQLTDVVLPHFIKSCLTF